ncbi:unnamed protein product [Macrosiphum euphorbiae]|uniref:Secreted protein n=1 Tax=Macrosiphum euphorbiae TaxID=13131 RepID=A0AAV0WM19_9HEMI|nr:unnamed protein product [Macrosiphum euphorbiae]
MIEPLIALCSIFAICSFAYQHCLAQWVREWNHPPKNVLESEVRRGVRGVRGSSFGSLDCEVIGLELRQASIWERRVATSSKVKHSVPITLCKWYFTDFTQASHSPPICGAFGGMKCHSMLSGKHI